MQPQFIPPAAPSSILMREHAIGNCLAVLGGLNPYLTDGGVFYQGVGGAPGTLPVIKNEAVKKYASATAIKALMRLDSILDDDKLWDGRDITKMQNAALRAVSAQVRAVVAPDPHPSPLFTGHQQPTH